MSTNDAVQEVERAWDEAHEKLRRAFEEREALGAAFWAKLLELEVAAYRLGQQLDTLYREHRPAAQQIRPATPVDHRAETQEVRAAALPFVPLLVPRK